MRIKLILGALTLPLAILTVFPGCSDVKESVMQTIDCQKLCANRQECVEENYDVSACRTDCEAKSKSDQEFQDDAHVCQACIENKACAEQIKCFTSCPLLQSQPQ